MQTLVRTSTILFAGILLIRLPGFAQSPPANQLDTVRVTVKINADGSRSVLKFDDAQHKCSATTTDQDGKIREKIDYELDDAGRFTSGQVFGPDGHLRFKSRYKYDSGGRMQEEIQMDDKDAVLHKIVYSYDENGRQTGYSILDASGKVVGRTGAMPLDSSLSPKPRKKK